MYYAPVGRCMLVVCPGCMAKEWDAIYVPNAEADAAFISKLSAARSKCVDDFDCFDIDVATEPAGLVQREAIAKQAQEVKKLQIKAAVAAVRTARGQGASGATIIKAVQEATKRYPRPAQLPRSEDTSSRGGASIEHDYRRTYLVLHGACERWLSSAPSSRANLTERWIADTMNFVVQQTAEECADALAFRLPTAAALVYVDDTAWDVPVIERLATRLKRELRSGAVVVHNTKHGYEVEGGFRRVAVVEVGTSWNPKHLVYVEQVL